MRPIKFRAWDKTLKRMEYNHLWEFSKNMMDSIGEDIVPMQYIGFKDKKKKEIYDGDWVKIDDGIGKVEWSPKGFWCMTFCKGKPKANKTIVYLFDKVFSKEREIEVIGNIYENPEGGEKK